MRIIPSRLYASLLFVGFYFVSWTQGNAQTIEATLCDLYQHPDQYAGKMVRVRGTVAGNDMWIDTFAAKPCPSWMSIVVVLPKQVKPAPDFDLVRDDAFKEFEEAMYHPRPIHIEATFEGRFDSAVTIQNGKRTRVSRGYGEKQHHDGRIVLRSVSEVTAKPLSRK